MSNKYGPSISLEDLLLYYDIGNINCHPGSGTELADLSGNGYTGLIVGAPTYNSAGYISLNGTSQKITLSLNLDELADYTFSFIASSTETGGNQGFFGCGGSTTGHFSWNHSGANTLLYNAGTNYRYFVASSYADDGNFHYWTFKYPGATAATYYQAYDSELYIDNNVISLGAENHGAQPNTWGNITIGNYASSGGNYWEGNLGMFSIHSKLLSTDEIESNFNAFKGRLGL